jgi:hypothetical protein
MKEIVSFSLIEMLSEHPFSAFIEVQKKKYFFLSAKKIINKSK